MPHLPKDCKITATAISPHPHPHGIIVNFNLPMVIPPIFFTVTMAKTAVIKFLPSSPVTL